jgi:hypothetical protein
LTRCAETAREGEVLFPPGSPFAFSTSDPLAGYVSGITATGWNLSFSKLSESPATHNPYFPRLPNAILEYTSFLNFILRFVAQITS